MTTQSEPNAQIPQITIDTHSMRCVAGFAETGLGRRSTVKGSLTCLIAKEIGGTMGSSARRPNQLPAAEKKENGTRNFAEAASHNPYRAWGPYLLNAMTRRPAAAANSVDCHKWFAIA